MNNSYVLARTHELSRMREGRVEAYPWGGEYRPEVRFRAGWSDSGLRVWMECREADPLRRVNQPNGRVWCDSCMEFFLAPGPRAQDGYFNFEMNALGAMLLGFGVSDAEFVFEDFPRSQLPLRAEVLSDRWTLDLSVPFALIQRRFPGFCPQSGTVMHGNFYKCGDETAQPHFGCRFSIDASQVPEPNFHRPEYFGALILE